MGPESKINAILAWERYSRQVEALARQLGTVSLRHFWFRLQFPVL
jgi:hypothetical protein